MKTAVLIQTLVLFFLFFGIAAADENETAASGTEAPAVALEDVVVTGEGLSDRSLMEAPASVTVITAEEIEANTARTVDDLLKTTAGVDVYKPWGFSAPPATFACGGLPIPGPRSFCGTGCPSTAWSAAAPSTTKFPWTS